MAGGGLLRRRHRPADPRRCRLARFPRLPVRDNIVLMPRPPTAPELNSVDPSQGSGRLARPRRPGLPRGHPRCVLRRLECPDGQIRGHRVSWNQRLGAGQNLGRLVLYMRLLRQVLFLRFRVF
jgi:hypothetical protein